MQHKNKPAHRPALTLLLILGILAGSPALARSDYRFQDPLDTAAIAQPNLNQLPLMAMTQTDNRIIAVGMRGVIIYSEDQGSSWQQASVPVQSDLVAIHFSDPDHGWVSGHNGVILHSSDGGKVWHKQLDGRQALEPFRNHYLEQVAAGNQQMQGYAELIDMNFAPGPALPLLNIWFDDNLHGYAVGAFGTLLRTADGGQNWFPALEQIDNPESLHLNAIERIDGHLYIASERGTIFHMDAQQRFTPRDTGYNGGLFGLTGGGGLVLAYGLGGQLFASSNHGQHWQPVSNPSTASLTGGIYNSSNKGFTLVNNAGQLMSWLPGNTSLQLMQSTNEILTDVGFTTNEGLMVTSLNGFQRIRPQPSPRL